MHRRDFFKNVLAFWAGAIVGALGALRYKDKQSPTRISGDRGGDYLNFVLDLIHRHEEKYEDVRYLGLRSDIWHGFTEELAGYGGHVASHPQTIVVNNTTVYHCPDLDQYSYAVCTAHGIKVRATGGFLTRGNSLSTK